MHKPFAHLPGFWAPPRCAKSGKFHRPVRLAGRPSKGGCLHARITALLQLFLKVYIDYVPELPGRAAAGNHDGAQAGIVESDGRRWRGVQQMQGHAVAPDGGAAFYYYERTPGDGGRGGGGD